jgi:glycosyltransferase involved in cell wall biosynthesis
VKAVAVLPLYPPHSRVGAWLATHTLLAGGVQAGWEVDVVTYMAAASTYTLDGVTVYPQTRKPDDALDGVDVVVTHLGDNGHAAVEAEKRGIPQVRIIHGWAEWCHKRLTMSPPALAVFNSRSLLERVGWDGPSVVVHPPVWPARFETTPGDCITLTNLARDKGAELFWLLARTNPQWKWLGVKGGYGSQIIKRLDQVEVVKTVEDIRDVLCRTRILLCPSKHESYGMVGLEACVSGIPVIAADLPGLHESLGDGGIFIDTKNLRGWRDTITRLQDPAEWLEASERALKRGAELDPQADVDRFVDAVECVL